MTTATPSKLKEFLADAKALVGKDAPDVGQGVRTATWTAIQRLTTAIGDTNRLYNDAAQSVGTIYNTMIAPPSFILAVRTPESGATWEQKEYGLRRFATHMSAEWNDIIRMSDRQVSDLKVSAVRAGKKWGTRETVEVDSTATYKTLGGQVYATATGTVTMVPHEVNGPLLSERGIHVYSDDEIKKLDTDLHAAAKPARGRVPLYWSEVKKGDKLPGPSQGPALLQRPRRVAAG